MEKFKLLLLPGDGIGPEITESVKKIIFCIDDLFKINFKLNSYDIGFKSLKEKGTTFPAEVLNLARNSDVLFLVPFHILTILYQKKVELILPEK